MTNKKDSSVVEFGDKTEICSRCQRTIVSPGKFKGLFGKFRIRWGYRKIQTELDGFKSTGEYELVARDSRSVVVRSFDELWQEHQLRQIHFECDYYWLWTSANIREYFRRVKDLD